MTKAGSRELGFAVAAMRGQLISARAGTGIFSGAATDSRQVRAGQLFFALPGERVDGFGFCAQAAAAGAAALVVERTRGLPPDCGDVPVIAVEDPRRALGDLARAVRAEFRGKVIGITGSNGKTTTKELTAAALAADGRVLRTRGNLNTDVGLPLTILSATGDEAFWVLEMAMRGRGEIAYLAEIARPHVGVITNVAAAHIERLGSLEEVARAKGELFAALGEEAVAVLPAGDPLIEEQAAHLPEARKVRFDASGSASASSPGVPSRADVRILEYVAAGAAGAVVRYAVRHQPVVVRLPLAGIHNARNGAAALAVAAAVGVPAPRAAAAMEKTELPAHRSAAITVDGRVILDDCYNANPASMMAALAAVASSAGASGRAFAILGDMLELGPDERALHRQVGDEAARRLAGLCTVGALGAEILEGARAANRPAVVLAAAADPDEAARQVAAWTRPGDWILVKASRGAQLERAVVALEVVLREGAAPKPPAAGSATDVGT